MFRYEIHPEGSMLRTVISSSLLQYVRQRHWVLKCLSYTSEFMSRELSSHQVPMWDILLRGWYVDQVGVVPL